MLMDENIKNCEAVDVVRWIQDQNPDCVMMRKMF